MFYQPIGAKLKCAGTRSLSKSVSPTTLQPILTVTTTRNCAKLLCCTLYKVCQLDQHKSTGAKAARRTLMKLTPAAVAASPTTSLLFKSISWKKTRPPPPPFSGYPINPPPHTMIRFMFWSILLGKQLAAKKYDIF